MIILVCIINSIIFYDEYINNDIDGIFFKRTLFTWFE